MTWEPVIGLEVHVELNTQSKMFCGCPAEFFGKEPNSQTCPVCLGLPGALPVTNEVAIRKAILVGLSLHCSINPESFFERKNYFYPDLPKGFQISQYQKPLCVNGFLEIEGKKYRINRAHMEEDTGKLTHQGNTTLIDFNRSGVPLLEVVSEADFRDAKTARKYLEKIQELVRLLGVSEADMEKGSMRLEANVSIQQQGQYEVGQASVQGLDGYQPNPKVELKNINSFRFVEKAINFELNRQEKVLGCYEQLKQETRGWDEKKNITYVQRTKEGSSDYRYFPEPDLPPMTFSDSFLESLRQEVKSLLIDSTEEAQESLIKLGLSAVEAGVLGKITGGPQLLADVSRRLPQVPRTTLASLIINRPEYRQADPETFFNLYQEAHSGVIQDQQELEVVVGKVLGAHPQARADYQNGQANALQFLMGQVMRETKGKADPEITHKALRRRLASYGNKSRS